MQTGDMKFIFRRIYNQRSLLRIVFSLGMGVDDRGSLYMRCLWEEFAGPWEICE